MASMTRDEARQYIRVNWRQLIAAILPAAKLKVNGETSYICPKCGHGSNGDGLTFIPSSEGQSTLKCFSCNWHGDILDLYGEARGLDYNATLADLSKRLGVTIDQGAEERRTLSTKAEIKSIGDEAAPAQPIEAEAADEPPKPDYSTFFLQAAANLERTDYHRGISLDTLKRFQVGYIADWKHPDRPTAPPSPRLIIPTSDESYFARDTREGLTPEQERYSKQDAGDKHLFNVEALNTATQPIIIVEGEIDALSIIDAGGEAIGLGGTSMIDALVRAIDRKQPKQPLIIALDNDEPGRQAAEKLKKELARVRASEYKQLFDFYELNLYGGHKDANEALNADREGLRAAVAKSKTIREDTARARVEKESAAGKLRDFLNDINDSKQVLYTPTGFESLDAILDGGLYAGLYIVGAISSLGKTTFCLQIADQIAHQGRDVLIFSLEMARNELMGKSISRLTYLEDMIKNNSTTSAKTIRGILTGSRYEKYNATEREIIAAAIEDYKRYANHIFIIEGVGNVTAQTIRERTEQHIHDTGIAPVVIIDYLQIIAPADPRLSDKQNTDKAVLELKRLSRDMKIPVIGISSFNRENYTAPVNLTSFKESGAIEYSSDVLFGLQYVGMDYQDGEKDGERDKRIRALLKQNIEDGKAGRAQRVQVKILKNRNGTKGDTILEFYPKFSHFKDAPGAADEGGRAWKPVESKRKGVTIGAGTQ